MGSSKRERERTHLLCESDGFRCEVDLQLQNGARPCALADNVEDSSLDNQLSGLHLLLPVVKQLLCVELLSEGVPILLELLSLHMVLPALAQHRFNPLEVGLQLTINLKEHTPIIHVH